MLNIEDLKTFFEVRKGYDPETLRQRIAHVRSFISFCANMNMSLDSGGESFIQSKIGKLKNGTINNYLKSLHALDDYFNDRKIDIQVANGFHWFEDDSEDTDPLTTDELTKIRSYWRVITHPPRKKFEVYINELYRDITLFLEMTGVRINDALSLTINEIRDDKIRFRQQKTGKFTNIYLVEPLTSMLVARSLNRNPQQSIFVNTSSKKVLRQDYNEWLRNAGEALGIRDWKTRCHAHNIRHYFGLSMLKQGVDLRSIQKLMGHKNINTTAGYLDLYDSDLEESIKKHPTAQKFIPPVDQMRIIIEAIKSFHLDSDKRFNYSLKEENDKLIFELSLLQSDIDA